MAEKSKVSERIVEIDQCFGVSGQTLAVNGRVLIAEGVLTKSCRSGIKARQFFLFNDILVYGTILVQNLKYRAQRVIPLEEVSVRLLEEGEGETEHGWVLHTREKSFTVYAATRGEKTEWINAINRCTTRLLARRDKSPCREFAPLLQPSSSSSSCSSCHLPFSLLVRRRHCKRCGRLTCSECSSNRVLLPSRHNKPLRVCLACYTVLRDIKEEEVSVEDEEPGASRAGHWSQADTKSLYQLGDTGLWWDSFEEEPDFELVEEFDSQLTLTEDSD